MHAAKRRATGCGNGLLGSVTCVGAGFDGIQIRRRDDGIRIRRRANEPLPLRERSFTSRRFRSVHRDNKTLPVFKLTFKFHKDIKHQSGCLF